MSEKVGTVPVPVTGAVKMLREEATLQRTSKTKYRQPVVASWESKNSLLPQIRNYQQSELFETDKESPPHRTFPQESTSNPLVANSVKHNVDQTSTNGIGKVNEPSESATETASPLSVITYPNQNISSQDIPWSRLEKPYRVMAQLLSRDAAPLVEYSRKLPRPLVTEEKQRRADDVLVREMPVLVEGPRDLNSGNGTRIFKFYKIADCHNNEVFVYVDVAASDRNIEHASRPSKMFNNSRPRGASILGPKKKCLETNSELGKKADSILPSLCCSFGGHDTMVHAVTLLELFENNSPSSLARWDNVASIKSPKR